MPYMFKPKSKAAGLITSNLSLLYRNMGGGVKDLRIAEMAVNVMRITKPVCLCLGKWDYFS